MRGLRAWAAVAAAVAPLVGGAQGSHLVRGIMRDSASTVPIAGALVDLRGATLRVTSRTDEEGNFRFRSVPAGRYQISVFRIGFSELRRELDLGARDTTLLLPMVAISQRLNAFRVRGDIAAIYGMIGTLPDLLPLKDARIEVLGATKSHLTDSTGGFFIPLEKPGTYLVRMTHPAFQQRLFSIEVPGDRAVEASRMLDPGEPSHPGLEGLYRDADQRLRTRGMNSGFVPGAELRRGGAALKEALESSRSFTMNGLRIGPTACVFVNGMFRPNASLDMFRPEEIEAIEVYASGGEKTGWLAKQANGKCGVSALLGATEMRAPTATANQVRYYVIWLRK